MGCTSWDLALLHFAISIYFIDIRYCIKLAANFDKALVNAQNVTFIVHFQEDVQESAHERNKILSVDVLCLKP